MHQQTLSTKNRADKGLSQSPLSSGRYVILSPLVVLNEVQNLSGSFGCGCCAPSAQDDMCPPYVVLNEVKDP